MVCMFTEQSIAKLIRAFARARGLEETYAARLVTGSGDTLQRLDAGIGMTLRRANTIVQNISDRWPQGHPWPADIPRPPRRAKEVA